MHSSSHSLEQLAALSFTTSHAALPNGEPVDYILPPVCDVPTGPFLMGSDPERDPEADADELPQHWVEEACFQIATYPVTVAEYACYVNAGHPTPRTTGMVWDISWEDQSKPWRLVYPVVAVSWQEATQYAAWLAELTGQPWRLPTEAEWEKAARWDVQAGVSRIYPWGQQMEDERCNCFDWSLWYGTSPIGEFPAGASPCGAQDLADNVHKWTSSLYQPYPYVPSDGREEQLTEGERVTRGGSHGNKPPDVRTACRFFHNLPNTYDEFTGFRLVRTMPVGDG
ncbi:MAG: formylglycine-generating enzyme family protein [Ktedonobacterales bacterium]